MAQAFFTFADSAPDGLPAAAAAVHAANPTLSVGGSSATYRFRKCSAVGYLVDAMKSNFTHHVFFGEHAGGSQLELATKLKRTRANSSQADGFGGGLILHRQLGAAANYYQVGLGTLTTNIRRLTALRYVASAVTTLTTNTTALSTTHGAADFEEFAIFMRARITAAGVITGKVWWEDESEPGSWVSLGTDTNFSSGFYGLTVPGFNGMSNFEFLSVGTAGDSAPLTNPAGPWSVSGVVTDDAGSPAARTVRVYHRTTGVLLATTISNATTGAYSVSLPYNAEVDVVFLDDDGGVLLNDIVHRVLPA